MQEKKWYIVHVRTLYEDKVKKHIEKEIAKKNLDNKIFEIVVPTEDVVEIRKNKKYIKKRKFFPGYMLISMILDDYVYWVVKNAPGVTSFLGGENPIPMPANEAKLLLEKISNSTMEKPKPAITFDKDENVRIMEGPFANFVGVVDEINQEKGRLTVMVTIFGRSTPVVVDFLQVEKI
jgi:transcriptional antiterminator NusG